jgi:hypothetical protein
MAGAPGTALVPRIAREGWNHSQGRRRALAPLQAHQSIRFVEHGLPLQAAPRGTPYLGIVRAAGSPHEQAAGQARWLQLAAEVNASRLAGSMRMAPDTRM